ncbi:MAG TPA: BamA/TamA family outer membrane protein [Myxococcales bacterium]|nr:BamA/TamA family outer membrane protein [Myxococcales bacterium]
MRPALLLLLAAFPALALDPRFDWETLETPHFQVHYHQGTYRYAQKVARAAELSHERLAPLLDHLPSGATQIVVQDDTDFANGNATPLLYNLIHAYAPPPDSRSTLADFDENVYELISHEYTHILHLDTVLGLPEVVNDIFGKLWITNGGQPIWFIEGIATFAESEVSAAGRLRASEEEMTVRAEALAGTLPRIDRLSNLPLEWPRGFGQYTVGSRFLSFISAEYGLGALRDLSHDFAGRAIPFGLNFSADRVLGESYLDLYREYAAEERSRAERVQARVRAEGETRVEPLTRLGEWVRTPRWSPDGQTLYYTNSGPDRLPEIRALRPGRCCGPTAPMVETVREGDRHVANLWSDGAGDATLAVAPDGRVLFARAEVYQQFELLQELYSVDPRSGQETRLTRGVRARSPDCGPDGTIVFVWRRPGGRTAIAELRPEGPRTLFEDPAGEPVDSPRVSPDGRRVAFLHHRDGAWDLQIVDRTSLQVSDVTRDRALDRDPAWTPDGEWLLFSSDRSGVYDIYAWRPGDLRQVTNVVLGAFDPAPSPDGTQLALVAYGVRGYDVARMTLDPRAWKTVAAPALAEQRPPPTPLPPLEVYPAHPYSPWETLLPHFWLPFAATDGYGTTVGALTAGFDAVDRHEYAAAAWWSLEGKTPGWDILYLNHSFYPDVTMELTGDIGTPQAAGGLDAPGFYYERSVGGSVTASFPFSRIDRTQSLSLTYELENLTVDRNPGAVPTSPGLLAAATMAYSWSDVRRFVRGISAERGQLVTLALRISDPALGSHFSFWQSTISATKYFALPWSTRGVPWHHALALRGSFGIARGDLSNRHDFFLGGFQQGDPVNSVLNPAAGPLRILRGFARDAFHGTEYLLGTAEYRFPIWNVETGAWTLPVYLRRLHGAVYTDVGDAFSPGRADFALHAGAGAELRAEVVLGFILPTDLRLGCARGLSRGPLAILDCYLALGGVF